MQKMPNWEDFLHNHLINFQISPGKLYTKALDKAGIFSLSDGKKLASSPSFSLQTYKTKVLSDISSIETETEINEFNNLKDAFENNGDCTLPGGIRINGDKYFLVGFDSKATLEKKTKEKPIPNTTSVIKLKRKGGGSAIAITKTVMIIGTISNKLILTDPDGIQHPQAPIVAYASVTKLANKIINLGL